MRNAVDLEPQRPTKTKTPVPARLSKQESLRLATVFKRGVLIATTMGFGIFAGLVARHIGGASASQPSSIVPSSQTAVSTQATPPNTGSASDLFNAQGQGGYGFGGNGGQVPVTGTSAS
jgi:hypothetical protein